MLVDKQQNRNSQKNSDHQSNDRKVWHSKQRLIHLDPQQSDRTQCTTVSSIFISKASVGFYFEWFRIDIYNLAQYWYNINMFNLKLVSICVLVCMLYWGLYGWRCRDKKSPLKWGFCPKKIGSHGSRVGYMYTMSCSNFLSECWAGSDIEPDQLVPRGLKPTCLSMLSKNTVETGRHEELSEDKENQEVSLVCHMQNEYKIRPGF